MTVSPTERDDQNIIMWMDHRALTEAAEINATSSEVLKFVGGEVSPEMGLPKLKWLKLHLPKHYERTARFFDLSDYLVYRSSGRTKDHRFVLFTQDDFATRCISVLTKPQGIFCDSATHMYAIYLMPGIVHCRNDMTCAVGH